jgi:hypothetical protein
VASCGTTSKDSDRFNFENGKSLTPNPVLERGRKRDLKVHRRTFKGTLR